MLLRAGATEDLRDAETRPAFDQANHRADRDGEADTKFVDDVFGRAGVGGQRG